MNKQLIRANINHSLYQRHSFFILMLFYFNFITWFSTISVLCWILFWSPFLSWSQSSYFSFSFSFPHLFFLVFLLRLIISYLIFSTLHLFCRLLFFNMLFFNLIAMFIDHNSRLRFSFWTHICPHWDKFCHPWMLLDLKLEIWFILNGLFQNIESELLINFV